MIKMAIMAAFYCAIVSFFLSSIFYYVHTNNLDKRFGKFAARLGFVGFFANSIVLLLRIMLTGQGPFSNSVEFLTLLAWLCALFYIIFEYKFKTQAAGFFMMLLVAVLLLFIAIIMPRGLIIVNSQPPVLKSIWLTSHVLTAVLAYGAFALAAAVAASYLLSGKQSKGFNIASTVYGIIVFGFVLLTVTIILGAIWAEQAWGRYWSWDPKEIWSLITWAVYALYFHFRGTKKWQDGQMEAIFALGGFIVVLFTFFGVNFLMQGMHSYA
jgi:ABC-type transport system involved in cytochrome c biogenesis permease subunit